MSKEIFYIGVDVGQEELWVAIEGYKPRCFTHTVVGVKGLWNWVRGINSKAILHFCMEATGVYSQRLAAILSSYEDTELSIINPAQIASFSKAQLRRSNTDWIACQVILAFAQSQKPKSWRPEPEFLRKLYTLIVQADALRVTQRQWANRAHTQGYVPDLPKIVRKTTTTLQKSIQKELLKVEKAIQELWESDSSLKTQIQLLCSVQCIGKRSATHLLGYGRTALTNYSARALVAHAGIAPRHHQSGISVLGKSHLAKEGDKRLRQALYMPTLVGIVHNPILKKHYQRLLARGKPKKVALVACMKKLLLIIRAILIKQAPFDPAFQSMT